MRNKRVAILGIPIDNLTMDEAVARIASLIEGYAADRRPRLVATVNVDFVVNTLTWRLGRPRHPELLDILRRADLVTPDGMPMVWASRLLGTPLKERVTGADLVPRLAHFAAASGRSIFFLGGRLDVGKRAADLLQRQHPGLTVAGATSPFVHVEGEPLTDADLADRSVIEEINRSGADILLIGFGNPKQEVWFERNRRHLTVPVSVGIGGTYEFITGSVKRAPGWMQTTGLEWIFRITQDPKRLWKRYFVGFFKFGLMLLPSVLYCRYRRLLLKLPPKQPSEAAFIPLPSTGADAGIQVIPVPAHLDAAALGSLQAAIDSAGPAEILVLDMSRVSFMDAAALGFLARLKHHLPEGTRHFFLSGLQPPARRFLWTNRLLDSFRDHLIRTPDEAVALRERGQLSDTFRVSMPPPGKITELRLAGVLDAARMADLDLGGILERIEDKDCLLDLGELNFVDSSGIMVFLKIHREVIRRDRRCIMYGLKPPVMQMFRITKLDRLFEIRKDRESAMNALGIRRQKTE